MHAFLLYFTFLDDFSNFFETEYAKTFSFKAHGNNKIIIYF